MESATANLSASRASLQAQRQSREQWPCHLPSLGHGGHSAKPPARPDPPQPLQTSQPATSSPFSPALKQAVTSRKENWWKKQRKTLQPAKNIKEKAAQEKQILAKAKWKMLWKFFAHSLSMGEMPQGLRAPPPPPGLAAPGPGAAAGASSALLPQEAEEESWGGRQSIFSSASQAHPAPGTPGGGDRTQLAPGAAPRGAKLKPQGCMWQGMVLPACPSAGTASRCFPPPQAESLPQALSNRAQEGSQAAGRAAPAAPAAPERREKSTPRAQPGPEGTPEQAEPSFKLSTPGIET